MVRRYTTSRRERALVAILALAAGATLLASLASPLVAQDPEAIRRRLWQAFMESRRKSRPDPPVGATVDRLIGLTLWHAPAGAADTAAPLQRLLPAEPVAETEHLRVGIEVAGRGYVYVIRRALLAGGTAGPPYLVFPTPRDRSSANVAAPGRLIEAPDRTDLAAGFTLARSSPEHLGERFTVLLTSSPLNAPPGGGPNPLPEPLVAAWERRATAPAARADAPQPLVPQQTPAEAESAQGTRLLASGDAPPQSVVQIRGPSDEPAAFSFELKFR